MFARALVVALTLATTADAGIVYHFSTRFVGRRYEFKQSGRVWAEGKSYRFEVDPDPRHPERPFDVAISTDADVTAKYLNTSRQTWYDRRRVGSTTRSSMLFELPVGGGRLGRRRVSHSVDGLEKIAGHTATRHVIDIDYEIEVRSADGRSVRGRVEAKVAMWMAGSLPQPPLQRPLRTGFQQIDAELARLAARMKGMALRHELTVTRTFGGERATEQVLTVVDEVVVAPVDPARFEIPSGYRHERP